MKYTAEEVRAIAKRLHDDITVADGDALMASDMLTAYAERIEADEAKALGTCPKHGVEYVGECSGCAMTLPEKDFTHLSAQAARCDKPGCNCATWKPEGCAWDDAEPVAQGELVDCPECGSRCTYRAISMSDDVIYEYTPAQAAQSVDIEAIRELIESHINEAKKLRHDPESQDYLYEQADKLEAAIKGEPS